MSLRDRLSDLVVVPVPDAYRCEGCGNRFPAARDACPECGGEVAQDETLAYSYLGPM